jgi:hypothetical protein
MSCSLRRGDAAQMIVPVLAGKEGLRQGSPDINHHFI